MAFTATATKAIPAAAAVLLLLIGPGARAQQPSQDQIAAIRASCRSDFMANCSGVTPGGKDALECLKRNLANLSGSCKTAVSAITPRPAAPAAALPAAPAPSAVGRCNLVITGAVEGEAGCQRQDRHPIQRPSSAPAQPRQRQPRVQRLQRPRRHPPVHRTPNVMVLPPREALRIVRICAADRQALCAGVPPGGGRIIACLMRNQGRPVADSVKNALAMAQARHKAKRRGLMPTNPPYRPGARPRSAA